ncbi:MAG TPA: XdhC/CoxI family protein, partial [Lentzea sp.]
LGSPVAIATVIEGPAPLGAQRLVWRENASLSLGSPHLDAVVTADVRARLGETCTLRFGEIRVFVQSYVPPPGLLVFGAIDFASALAHVGAFLGYRVTVCDARPVFTTPQRFPDAHEVVCDWPHRFLERVDVDDRTAICVLTHDPKFDVPALTAALNTRAGYVGVMGSRRAHEDRLTRLREAGVTDEQLARLSSPIGLDLGARTPQETAISIAAEIVACRNAGSGISLSRLTGPIHRLEADQVGARPGGSTGRNHSAR